MEIMLHPEWSYQAVIYEMNVRQLTREGTLRAAAAKLGFLRDMGIDAVWLMPVYPIGVDAHVAQEAQFRGRGAQRAFGRQLAHVHFIEHGLITPFGM